MIHAFEHFPGNSVALFAKLFAGTLSCQGLLHPALCARLEVEGVTLHFLNNVFRLNFALEPPQGTLDRLAFLQSYFCQIISSKLVLHIKFTLFGLNILHLLLIETEVVTQFAHEGLADFVVRIPMQGGCDSISVAVATGVLLFEMSSPRRRATLP